jgi:hypothetical protein
MFSSGAGSGPGPPLCIVLHCKANHLIYSVKNFQIATHPLSVNSPTWSVWFITFISPFLNLKCVTTWYVLSSVVPYYDQFINTSIITLSLIYSTWFKEVNNICDDHGRLYVIIINRRSIISVQGTCLVLLSMERLFCEYNAAILNDCF